jgi:S-(hydroxymethyl)glutathione dehydrogenase/alcohol dehydrogenase
MRAAVLRNTGDEKLEIRDDVELAPIGPNDVKVKIEATGVCHSDVSGMNGTIPQPAPFVPGHEGAGVVAEVGENVTNVAPGDHVIIAWSAPCGSCKYCVDRKQPNLCFNVQMVASMTPRFVLDGGPLVGFAGCGTWSEHMVMPQQGVVKIDPETPHEIASLVGCGGVGISAIQGARVAGASEIVAVDLVDSKLEDAQRFGATHAVKPDDLDSAKTSITGGDGFDYAFEAIGLPVTMRSAYDVTRRGGTTCIIGVGAPTETVSLSAFELFFNEKTLVGSYYGSADVRSDFSRMLNLWKNGRLDLDGMVSKKIAIDDVNDAVSDLKAGTVIRSVITF